MTDFTSVDLLVTMLLAGIAVFGILHTRAQVQQNFF